MRTTSTPAVGRLLLRATVAFLAACSGDAGGPASPITGIQQPEAAARAIGNVAPGFYWLSPIQPALASYPGAFDGARSPTIEICQWSGTTCGAIIATFSRAAGTISVDLPGQLYRADWSIAGLRAGVTYRVQVLEQGALLGFADTRLPAPSETPAQLVAQGIVPLGNSSRLPIRFRLESVGSPTVTITAPADGTIFPVGASITLTGSASDPQQGNISNLIVWRSNQVGTPLGTGASITPTLTGGPHTISASVTNANGVTVTTSIHIVVSIISVPATLNVPYGGTASLPVTLTQAAPAGGLTFNVSSAAPGTVGVASATLTIPAGQQSANVTVQGVAPGTTTVAISNANYGSASSQVSTTANLNIVQTAVSFAAGRTTPITIELQSQGANIAAPAGGIVVTLVSSNAACVAATSPVTIPAGLVSILADLSYGGSATTPCNARVDASVASVPAITGDFVNATVTPSPSFTFALGSTTIGAGLRANLSTLFLSAPAPAGGLTVTLTSSNAAVLLVSNNGATTVGAGSATLSVPANATNVQFYMHGNDGAAGTATVTASAPAYASATSASVTVASAGIDLVSLNSTTTSLSPDNVFVVRAGVVNTAGTFIAAEQEVRPGGTTIVATVTNSNASVAQLTTSGGSAQSRTVSIAPGQSRSPSTVAAGGIAFDPLGAGTTTVAATAPTAVSTTAASQLVTVSAPAFTFTLGNTSIGAGLRGNLSTLFLGAPAPAGGLTVTLTSSNGAVLLVSNNGATSVGAGLATLSVAAGATNVQFYMHGNDGAAGTATVTASAPSYTATTSASITVASAGIDILSLNPMTTTLSNDIPFLVRAGVVNPAGTALAAEQEVRPGGTTIVATVTNSNASVAQLTTTGGSAQSRTVSIVPGQSRSPSTVAAGGVAFDPLGAGTTTVAATAPTAISTTAASQVVTVSAPAFTFTLGNTSIGAGLRGNLSTLFLGAPAPAGGLTVTLTSSNAAVLLVSNNGATTVGAGTTTLSAPAGATNVQFYMHGNDGAAGTATVTATAPSYTATTSASITVASAGIDLLSLGTTTTTLSNDIPFLVRAGVVNPAGTALAQEQEVRPGGTSIVATVTNSNSAVAQLTTSGGSAQSRTVSIVPGQSRSPSTVAAGGIAFDPLSAGSTTVAASAPSVISTTAASQVVTVSAPTFTFTLGSTRIGAGLRANLSTLFLGAPAPAGGLTVTLTSSNAAVLLVSNNGATTVGTGATSLSVPAGATSVQFYMHGNDGSAGTVTLTAVAPGFTDATASVTVAAAGIDILSLGTTTAGAPNTTFLVRLGVVDVAGTSLVQEQELRPGGTSIIATVTNSNAGVAQLVTSAGSAQSRTVTIAVGQSRSPNSVALGGIAFDPLATGTTTVSASAGAGVVATTTATVNVTVNP